MDNIKYISFKYSTSNNKVGSLYLNNISNIKVCFETIKQVNVLEKAISSDQEGRVREILLSIKHNNTQLFVEVEQGKRVNQNDIHILISIKLRAEG